MLLKDQFWLCGCFLAGAAWAHQPFESTTTARLQHGRLEVVLTLSTDMAAMLVRSGDVESQPTAAYESYRPRLEVLAPGLLRVDVGGQPLAVQRVTVRQNQNGEPEIVYLYPPPPPGPLKFDAVYLRGLPRSYFGQLALWDENEEPLGKGILVPENAVAEITPRVASPAGAIVSPTPGVAVITVSGSNAEFRWLSVGAALAIGVAFWITFRRGRSPRDP